MAKTINISAALSIAGDGATLAGSKQVAAITQVGNASFAAVQTVGFASGEAVSLGDISGECAIYFQNTDSTNFVMVHTADSWSAPVIKLKAGEAAVIFTTGTTWYAKADTAAVDLLVVACER